MGIGLWATSGGLPVPHPMPTFYKVGLVLMGIGIITVVHGLMRRKEVHLANIFQDLSGVLPLLQEMDEHLRTL
jgi:hypothetical protein